MILYTDYDPRIIPVFGDSDWDEIDRVQTLDKTGTINKIRVDEVGNDALVGYIDQPPTIGYRLTQLEYGSLTFWEKLVNKKSQTSITLADFKTSAFDICAYLTDDGGTFKGTLWIPKLRTAGFSISVADPNSLLERSFDFAGEDWIHWQGNNKYLIYKECTVESGEVTKTITVSDPSAVQDPDFDSGDEDDYILRVVRVRSGTATELVAGTGDNEYSYSAPTLTIDSCETDDVIKYWYTAGSYIGSQTPFVANTSDLAGIHANSINISIESESTIYRLQGVTIDVRFDRQDLFELGNDNVVQRGVRNKTVTVTLGRIFEDATIEEVLRGKSADYGKLDLRKFGDELKVKVKVYSDRTHSTFKIGYCATKLAPSEIRGGTSVDNYVDYGNTMVGEALSIVNDETIFDAL